MLIRHNIKPALSDSTRHITHQRIACRIGCFHLGHVSSAPSSTNTTREGQRMQNKPSLRVKFTLELHALTPAISSNTLTHEEFHRLLQICLRRLHLWSAPRNWSEEDWAAEVCQLVFLSACEAARDFDPERG